VYTVVYARDVRRVSDDGVVVIEGGVGGVGASCMQASAQSVPYYSPPPAPILICALPPRLSAATDAADIIPVVPSIYGTGLTRVRQAATEL